ncbi:MAG: peptide deformylase [Candidatus Omnitrophota bacterium]|jgi:peptide deformylase
MKETASRIRLFGDPLLRKRAKPVHKVIDEHRQALSIMAQLMYKGSGIGLASLQAGFTDAMIVVDVGSGLYKVINPKVVEEKGTQALSEGCLSIPGICVKVRRAKQVRVRGLDETGKPVDIEAEDLLACVFQHEIDHLKGKMVVDYASFFEKLKIKNKLGQLRQRSKIELTQDAQAGTCQVQL